jgi:hypothetical protein
MTPHTTLARRDGPSRFLRFVGPGQLLGAGLVAAVLVVASILVPDEAAVDRLSLVNASEYNIVVEVRGQSGGWMVVGVAEHGRTTVVEQVRDQGERWTFRFTGQGERAGQLRLTRDQLEAARWRLDVPAAVVAELRDRGVPPPP